MQQVEAHPLRDDHIDLLCLLREDGLGRSRSSNFFARKGREEEEEAEEEEEQEEGNRTKVWEKGLQEF